jgi:hypothetical protein
MFPQEILLSRKYTLLSHPQVRKRYVPVLLFRFFEKFLVKTNGARSSRPEVRYPGWQPVRLQLPYQAQTFFEYTLDPARVGMVKPHGYGR